MLDLRGTFDYVWLKSDLTKIVRTNGPYIYFVRELVDVDFFFFACFWTKPTTLLASGGWCLQWDLLEKEN